MTKISAERVQGLIARTRASEQGGGGYNHPDFHNNPAIYPEELLALLRAHLDAHDGEPIRDGVTIGDPHVSFARALVELARKHKVGKFDGSFSLSFNAHPSLDGWAGEGVHVAWNEGRHGSESRIMLNAAFRQSFPETPGIRPDSNG